LRGEKEYLALAPNQAKYLYPKSGIEANKSQIDDLAHPDLERFPLFAQAEATRFKLSPGETPFVPAGWWHTARILSTSITVSINAANAPNWKPFTRDYCASIASASRFKAAILLFYMDTLGDLFSFFGQFFA